MTTPSQTFQSTCQNCKQGFVIGDEDLLFYEKMQVPPPTFCPQCRLQRRLSFINVRNLYLRKLSGSDKPFISMYSPDKPYNIVDDRDWWGDKYDFFSYGKEYDFQKPFFTQFRELMERAPLPHLQRNYSSFENSEYCNAASDIKNCYLTMCADFDENCAYCMHIENSKDCLDLLLSNKSELCYEGVELRSCYQCLFSEDCEDSSHLTLCRDCVGCHDCFGSIGLRHQSYHLFNQPYSKEEYEKKMSELKLGSWGALQKMKEQVHQFFLEYPRKFMNGRNNVDVSGDYIYQSKNVHHSFLVEKSEDCKYSQLLEYVTSGTHNAYDYTMFGVDAEFVYEAAWCGRNTNNVKFSAWNYGSADIEYCYGCHSSQNLFGCVGMRHQKYCILNKQYSKEEYEALVPKIKEAMNQIPYTDRNGNVYRYGEFFPIELSPFDYNQTMAQNYCPMTKEEASRKHYGWYESEERGAADFIHWGDLPDEIQQADEQLVGKPILCKAFEENPTEALQHNCSQRFKMIAQEFAFYKKLGLPLPRYCPNTRHYHRLRQLNPFRLYERNCSKCSREIQTTYAPERPEIILCEACYLKETY